ncbi:MAG: site-specific DNA recombinase [Pirellulaceae bacterium]|jgi:site-specific DNA recombinase
MSFRNYDRPKNGRFYRIIGVGRISTDHQDELSLSDQEAMYKKHLKCVLKDAEFEVTCIASRGSGQILERTEYLQLCEMVESGEYDIVVAEDLGRICRRIHAYIFCEIAEDSKTRVIAINDFIDTAQDGWQQSTFFASFKHESFCRDTSKRIRRSLRNRFQQGGVFQCPIYGYIKPHAKANDSEVQKDPDAEHVYERWFSMLEGGFGYQDVADWLNANNIPTGPHCRQRKWDGSMVGRITHNQILKGERRRNDRVTIRVNQTGKQKTIPAPEDEKLKRDVPALAFIEPGRYDRVIRKLEKKNAKYKRSETVRNDPRAGIPKRQTRWPGQHIRCGVCGRLYVYGGHGKAERLMCSGAREHSCWNGMTVSGPVVAREVANQARMIIENLPNFDEVWLAEYESQRDELLVTNDARLVRLNSELKSEQRKLGHLLDSLESLGSSDAVAERLRVCERKVADLSDQISSVQQTQQSQPSLPSLEELRAVAAEVFCELAVESPEFARRMLNIIDEFFVLPYRLIDGGHIQPRVAFRLCPLNLLNGHQESDHSIQQIECLVDLVTNPQRVVIREDVANMVAQNRKHGDIATQLVVTKTAVGNAMRLHRLMAAEGKTDPWLSVTTVEQAADYFKRIRHPRFNFKPLPGFESTRHPTD